MGILLELFLVICIVHFGSTSIQPYNQIKNQFQSVWNSNAKNDAKNDPKKNKISFKILKHEVSREQQVFDTMREELQIAQNINAYKKRNFIEENKINKYVVASKREVESDKRELKKHINKVCHTKQEGRISIQQSEYNGFSGTMLKAEQVQNNGTTLSPPPLDRAKLKQLCTDLKEYKQYFKMDLFVKAVNDLWLLMFPSDVATELKGDLRITCEGHMNEILKECGFRTELRTEFMRESGLQQAGVIDVRTLEKAVNTTHLVIKQRYKKPSCGAMIQILKCVETETFLKMYPQDKVMLLGFSFNMMKKEPIQEWVAILLQKGEIIGVQEHAKCIRSKEFNQMQYKNRLILDYMEACGNGTGV